MRVCVFVRLCVCRANELAIYQLDYFISFVSKYEVQMLISVMVTRRQLDYHKSSGWLMPFSEVAYCHVIGGHSYLLHHFVSILIVGSA